MTSALTPRPDLSRLYRKAKCETITGTGNEMQKSPTIVHREPSRVANLEKNYEAGKSKNFFELS